MSNQSQPDSEEHSFKTIDEELDVCAEKFNEIKEVWRVIGKLFCNIEQADIDRFCENTENRKHELYHQGQDEVGELMQIHEHEEDEDGNPET